MKRILFILLSLTGILACGSKTQPEKADVFQYQGEKQYSVYYGQSVTIKFRTNLAWHFECPLPETSVTFSQKSGEAVDNTKTYQITVQAGSEGYTGDTQVTLVAEGKTKHTQNIQLTFLPKEATESKARIMQLNILQAKDEDAGHEWTSVRKNPCIKMLQEISPDIICFEEARKTQCNDLASALTAYTQIKHPKDNIESNGGQRNLIMFKTSKYEQLEWNKYWFSVDGTATGDRFGDTKTTQKLTIYAKLREKSTQKIVWVYCTHFFADCQYQASREKCVEMSLASLKTVVPADETVFFLGDLNLNYADETGKSILSPLLGYMKSASIEAKEGAAPTATTYNKWGASTKVLDYILFRNATAQNYNIISDGTKYGTKYLSDHYPIWSDFTF